MARTGYLSTGAFFDTGIGVVRIHGDIEYSVSRSNNTVTFTGTRAIIKYVRESGSWTSFTYGAGWTWELFVNGIRQTNGASGTRNRDQEEGGTYVGFTVPVNTGDTTYPGYVGAYFAGDGKTYTGALTISIPSVGAPSSQSLSASAITVTTATLTAGIGSWGTNATVGSGQRIEYRKGSSGGWTALAYSTSTGHSRSLTGLKPGTTYEARCYAVNAVGLSEYSGTITFKTKSATNLLASLIS